MHKLIIVDDEALICNRLKNDIESTFAGLITSATANSAKQALSLFEKEKPDTMIIDIMMPEMDGLKLIEVIRAKDTDVNIIILSGYDEFRYAQRALELGVCMYLLKPVNIEKLTETLHALCQQKKPPVKSKIRPLEYILGQLDGSYCVAAFELGVKEKKNEYSDIMDLFLEEAETFFSKQCLLIAEQHLLFLLMPCADNTGLQAAEEQIGFFLSCFEKSVRTLPRIKDNSSIRLYFHVGIALPASGQKNLLHAKKDAEELLEYCYFSGNPSAVYNKVSKVSGFANPSLSSAILKKEVSAILYHILSANVLAATDNLKKFFNTNFRFVSQNRENFLMECNMFYLLLGLILEENGFCDIIIPTEQVYQEISAMESYNQVLSFFEEEIVRISRQITGIDIAKDNNVVFRIKQYVLKNYRKNISLSELSQTIYLSTSYLSTYFKKQTGQTISAYMIMVRIEQAKRLLVESNNTVNQIAEQVGYPGYRYFSTLFKSVTGVTPIQYRLRRMSDEQGGK